MCGAVLTEEAGRRRTGQEEVRGEPGTKTDKTGGKRRKLKGGWDGREKAEVLTS